MGGGVGKGRKFLLCFKPFPHSLCFRDVIDLPGGNEIWNNVSTLYVIYYILTLHERNDLSDVWNLQSTGPLYSVEWSKGTDYQNRSFSCQ